MQLRHTSPALAVAMLLLALPASALDTHVTPLVVNLPAGTTSQTITVQNMATSTLRIQVVAYKWTQDADSPEKLQPTDELVFFPSLLSIDPGGTRAVRVGLQNPSRSPLERTYRVMFRELPSLENAFAPNSATIKVQMQLSIPVYVEPLKPAPKPLLESVAVHGGKLSFRLSNPGNTHFKVLSLAVAGVDARGVAVSNESVESPVILANGAHEFQVSLDRASCARLREVTISVQTDGGSAKRTVAASPDQCR